MGSCNCMSSELSRQKEDNDNENDHSASASQPSIMHGYAQARYRAGSPYQTFVVPA